MTIKLTDEEQREMEAIVREEMTKDQQDIRAIRDDWQQFLDALATVPGWNTTIDAMLTDLRAQLPTDQMYGPSDMVGRFVSKSMVRWATRRRNLISQTGSNIVGLGRTTAGRSKITHSHSKGWHHGQTRRLRKR